MRGFVLAAGLGASLLAAGCIECRVDGEAVNLADGVTSPDETFYMTSEFGEDLIDFPGGKRLRLYHHLKGVPQQLETLVSFQRNPFGGNTSMSESAGNEVVIECVNRKYIQVYNDTCSHFYLRVAASLGPSSGEPVGTDPPWTGLCPDLPEP